MFGFLVVIVVPISPRIPCVDHFPTRLWPLPGSDDVLPPLFDLVLLLPGQPERLNQVEAKRLPIEGGKLRAGELIKIGRPHHILTGFPRLMIPLRVAEVVDPERAPFGSDLESRIAEAVGTQGLIERFVGERNIRILDSWTGPNSTPIHCDRPNGWLVGTGSLGRDMLHEPIAAPKSIRLSVP